MLLMDKMMMAGLEPQYHSSVSYHKGEVGYLDSCQSVHK